jgi:hypothetical protein
MSFVPEDGTGLANANSYVALAYADAYFAERSVKWTGSDTLRQSWLVRATDYINARFSSRLLGTKSFPLVQALEFPRILDSTIGSVMPVNLLKATCEYAYRAKLYPILAPDLVLSDNGLFFEQVSEKVGPIDTTTKYFDPNKGFMLIRPYPAADLLIRPFLSFGRTTIRN